MNPFYLAWAQEFAHNMMWMLGAMITVTGIVTAIVYDVTRNEKVSPWPVKFYIFVSLPLTLMFTIGLAVTSIPASISPASGSITMEEVTGRQGRKP